MFSQKIRCYMHDRLPVFLDLVEKYKVDLECVNNVNCADVAVYVNPTEDTVNYALEHKREYTELVVYTTNGVVPYYTHKDIRLLLSNDMSMTEIDYYFRQFVDNYYVRLNYAEKKHCMDMLINNVPNLVWCKTKDGVHTEVNSFFCEVVNKEYDDVIGKHHAYIWGVEKDDPACIESEEKVMTEGRMRTSGEIIKTAQGSTMHLMTYKSPIYDRNGECVGTVGVGIDITQVHNMGEALIKRNDALEKLFKTLGCGVICYTAEGNRIVEINQKALDILGYRDAESLLKAGFDGIADSVVAEDRDYFNERLSSLKEVGDSVNLEYRVRHTNGKVIHVLGDAKLIMYEGMLCYQRYLLDNTEAVKKFESERKKDESIIRALSSDYCMVCYFDLATGKGRVLYVDEQYRKIGVDHITGTIDMDKYLRRFVEKYVHVDDRGKVYESFCSDALSTIFEVNKITSVSFRADVDGTIIYLKFKAVDVHAKGNPHGVAIGLRNVDDAVRTEMRRNEELEVLLKAANAANEAKSKFLSDMSHDIRTPMNAVINYTSLATKHMDSVSILRDYLSKLMIAGKQLLGIVNNVLDMSSIEGGKLYLKLASCWLPDLLLNMEKLVQDDAVNKGIDLVVNPLVVDHEYVLCDESRLSQVLLNILNNAVKYTQTGGRVEVTVCEESYNDGVATYSCTIKDTGIGMSEEFLSKVYTAFEREHNTTLGGIEGTGLGMSITKMLVDMMKGNIDITSKPGVGTTVKVTVSFEVDKSYENVEDIAELNDKYALIIADDKEVCDSVSSAIGILGMHVEYVTGGTDVKYLIDHMEAGNNKYKLFVIDLNLKVGDGLDVVKELRFKVGDDSIILIVTPYDVTALEAEGEKVGVSGFCQKPVYASQISHTLKSLVLSGKHGVDSEVSPIDGKNIRLLLVDDNELNMEILVTLLEDLNPDLQLEQAINGEEAVKMVVDNPPGYYDLVFMDIQMPIMNGYDATREIRALPESGKNDIPIFAVTANAFEEDIQNSKDAGMDGHLAKPVDPDDLQDVLETEFGSQ